MVNMGQKLKKRKRKIYFEDAVEKGKQDQTVFLFTGHIAPEWALSSPTPTYREAHMVSENNTLSGLFGGACSMCQAARAQGL